MNQSSFGLSVVYYPVQRSVYVQNLDTDIFGQKAAEVVRSVLAAQLPNAAREGSSQNYTNLQVDTSNNLKVTSEITDGNNGPVEVKPPNTPAISSDPALVVAISPNNPITVVGSRPTTNNTSSVAASTSNVTLLPSNSVRIGATIYNDSSALLYVKLGVVTSTTDFTIKLFPLSYYEVPYGYTGEIDAIWSVANGFARVGELTL